MDSPSSQSNLDKKRAAPRRGDHINIGEGIWNLVTSQGRRDLCAKFPNSNCAVFTVFRKVAGGV